MYVTMPSNDDNHDFGRNLNRKKGEFRRKPRCQNFNFSHEFHSIAKHSIFAYEIKVVGIPIRS